MLDLKDAKSILDENVKMVSQKSSFKSIMKTDILMNEIIIIYDGGEDRRKLYEVIPISKQKLIYFEIKEGYYY